MSEEIKDNSQSVTGNEGGDTPEQAQAETPNNDGKDYKQLYENQKIRAEKAESQLKQYSQPKEVPVQPDTSKNDSGLIEKTYLRAAGIIEQDEVDLALQLSGELNMSVDKLVDHKFFQSELDSLRTEKANIKAASNIKGGSSKSEARNTVDYWQAKGEAPTPQDIPDGKTRRKIVRQMVQNAKGGTARFYND